MLASFPSSANTVVAALLSALLVSAAGGGSLAFPTRGAHQETDRGFGKPVRGTAVIETRSDTSDGILLEADGRLLLVGADARYVPEDSKSKQVATAETLRPGNFLRYTGQRTASGRIRVAELAAWENNLEEEERQLYQSFEPEMRLPPGGDQLAVLGIWKNRYTVLDDRAVQQYIERLGTQLLPAFLRDPETAAGYGHKFWFVVVSHSDTQASAYPGGAVVIHSGLFHMVQNEAQLAFVVAHETAHVVQKHAWREALYPRGTLRTLRWTTAGASYIVESAIRRGYLRELEAQADRLALAAMVRAGFDPRESISLLNVLERHKPYMSALFWDTHRSYGQRRKQLQEELAAYVGDVRAAEVRSDSPEFQALRELIPRAKLGAPRPH